MSKQTTRPYRVLLWMPTGGHPWVLVQTTSAKRASALAEARIDGAKALHVVSPDLDCQGVPG